MAGRPSKLSDQDRADARKRLLAGETIASVARLYNMAPSSIREGFSAEIRKVKMLANQIVTTEQEMKQLPISVQLSVMDFAATLRSISSNLCEAASTGSSNASRLHAIAAAQLNKIGDPENLDDEAIDALKIVRGLSQSANDAAKLGIDLIAANKAVAQAPASEEVPTLADFYKQG